MSTTLVVVWILSHEGCSTFRELRNSPWLRHKRRRQIRSALARLVRDGWVTCHHSRCGHPATWQAMDWAVRLIEGIKALYRAQRMVDRWVRAFSRET